MRCHCRVGGVGLRPDAPATRVLAFGAPACPERNVRRARAARRGGALRWRRTSRSTCSSTSRRRPRGPPPTSAITRARPSRFDADTHARAGGCRPGHDVSWPQCNDELPDESAFAIIGVNRGRPFSQNDCFVGQLEWAGRDGRLLPQHRQPRPGSSSSSGRADAAAPRHTGATRRRQHDCAYRVRLERRGRWLRPRARRLHRSRMDRCRRRSRSRPRHLVARRRDRQQLARRPTAERLGAAGRGRLPRVDGCRRSRLLLDAAALVARDAQHRRLRRLSRLARRRPQRGTRPRSMRATRRSPAASCAWSSGSRTASTPTCAANPPPASPVGASAHRPRELGLPASEGWRAIMRALAPGRDVPMPPLTRALRAASVAVLAAALLAAAFASPAAAATTPSNPTVAPPGGTTASVFTFSVSVVADNAVEVTAEVSDGTTVSLSHFSGSAPDGTYRGSVSLPAGTWTVTFVADGPGGGSNDDSIALPTPIIVLPGGPPPTPAPTPTATATPTPTPTSPPTPRPPTPTPRPATPGATPAPAPGDTPAPTDPGASPTAGGPARPPRPRAPCSRPRRARPTGRRPLIHRPRSSLRAASGTVVWGPGPGSSSGSRWPGRAPPSSACSTRDAGAWPARGWAPRPAHPACPRRSGPMSRSRAARAGRTGWRAPGCPPPRCRTSSSWRRPPCGPAPAG